MAIRRIKVNGRWAYQARVACQGARRSRLCASREDARTAEAEILQGLKGAAAQADAAGATPADLRVLCELYEADLAERGKGTDTVCRAAGTRKALERLLPALFDRPVSDLTAADLYTFRAARTKGLKDSEGRAWVVQPAKPSTVDRDLRTLRAMLKKAWPEFKFPGGTFFPEDETRVRWLRPEEEVVVFDPMPSPFREIARLAFLTLMRQQEVNRLRREQVDLGQGVVMLPRAKGGPRPVVLNTEARDLLRQQLNAHTSEWVFPSPNGSPYSRVHVGRVWRKMSRAAGLKDFHFHDLRHHGATMALNGGMTAPIVMALGG